MATRGRLHGGPSLVVAVVILVAVATLALRAAPARADGDPASDYLVGAQVFLSSQPGALTPAQRRLEATVAAANRAGLTVRVATVGDRYDLGSVTALWGQPENYARFLSLELASAYRGRLLVVMPAGIGIAWVGHGTAVLRRALRGAPAAADLAVRARAAVAGLARAAGVALPLVPAAPVRSRHAGSQAGGTGSGSPDGGGVGPLPWILAVVALAAIAAAAVELARRRPRWRLPGFAGLAVLAGAVPVLVVAGFHRGTAAPGSSALEAAIAPPLQWPAGSRPAPDFALRDQTGASVSLRRLRGHPVLLTFADPLCRNLCPVEAHVLNATVAGLPPARRPAIVAVSTDVYADRRTYLLQDVRRWSLVPQWHWAVGPPAALRSVWGRYKIGVKVVNRRIGETTIHEISHSEVAYLIDGTGHERALFLWPFRARDVVSELRRIG